MDGTIMLLALDTATTTASLAVYDLSAGQLLAEMTWQARRRQTQDLLGAARDLLALVGTTPAAMTALAVTTGPGSFTGVRIAISAVKGIGLGLPEPPLVIGIPTLSVTAAPWLTLAAKCNPPAVVCACIQAGRGRYNWAWFDGDLLVRPDAQAHCAGGAAEFGAALAEAAPQPIWLTGEVASDLADAVANVPHVTVIDPTSSLRRAGQLARLAALHFAAGPADSLETLQPLYLRNP
jgi:tRNA threonylcarbamoyladenosine biosynthesis protein TsaB